MFRLFPRKPARDPPWPCGIRPDDLTQNLLITGATGSGKSSLMQILVRRVLEAGWGCLLVAAKPGDARRYYRLAAAAGRERDTRVFAADLSWGINLSDAVRNRQADLVTQALQLQMAASLVFESLRAGRDELRAGEQFFVTNAEASVREAFLAILLANFVPTVPLVKKVLETVPNSPGEVPAGACVDVLRRARELTAAVEGERGEELRRLCAQVEHHLLRHLPNIHPKTRMGIIASFTGPADMFKGVAERVLYAPQVTLDLRDEVAADRVLIIDFPAAEWGGVSGVVTGGLKYAVQRTLLQRDVTPDTRPFVLFLDEYGSYANSFDAEFLSMCRGSRGGCVLAIQGRENLLGALKGQAAEHEADTITGNCRVHLHMKPTHATARWLIDSLGQVRKFLYSGGVSGGGAAYRTPLDLMQGRGGDNAHASFSEQYAPVIQTSDLAAMKTGGPGNHKVVHCLRVPGSGGTVCEKVQFTQEDLP